MKTKRNIYNHEDSKSQHTVDTLQIFFRAICILVEFMVIVKISKVIIEDIKEISTN
jgi:hypothetical protein